MFIVTGSVGPRELLAIKILFFLSVTYPLLFVVNLKKQIIDSKTDDILYV